MLLLKQKDLIINFVLLLCRESVINTLQIIEKRCCFFNKKVSFNEIILSGDIMTSCVLLFEVLKFNRMKMTLMLLT